MINKEIRKLFEDNETMYDKIELGSSDKDKKEIFKLLQSIAFNKGMVLNRQILKDQASGNILVDSQTEDPLAYIFDTLELDTLVDMPRRQITIDNIMHAQKSKDTAIINKEGVNTYTMIFTMTKDARKDVDIKEILGLLNNMFDNVQATVTSLGKSEGELLKQYKFSVITPINVSEDDVEKIVGQNKGTLKQIKVKSVDVYKQI